MVIPVQLKKKVDNVIPKLPYCFRSCKGIILHWSIYRQITASPFTNTDTDISLDVAYKLPDLMY